MNKNITVNGESLEKYIGQQQAAEIATTRDTENRPRGYHSQTSKHRANTSGARSGLGRVIWEKGQKATHVMFCGEVFPWMDKAPFVASGKSTFGAAEYCESTKEFKCHECGEWVRGLGNHVRLGHRDVNRHKNLTLREYKIRHGFTLRTGFSSPDEKQRLQRHASRVRPSISNLPKLDPKKTAKARRESMAARLQFSTPDMCKSPELANLVSKCKAQTGNELTVFANGLGRIPTRIELESYISPHSGEHVLRPTRLKRLYGVPASRVMIGLGLSGRGRGAVRNSKGRFCS